MSDQKKDCPNCGERVVREAREGGTVYPSPRYVRLTADQEAVIGCKGCGAELEVRRGGLLIFKKRSVSAVPAPAPEAGGGAEAPAASSSAPEGDARETRPSPQAP